MPDATIAIQRPQRWDVPFDPDMTDADVDRLLSIEPFASIDPEKFPPSTPLHGILKNDARLVKFNDGDLIVREGDYGSSAFLILSGAVRVTLENLPNKMLGRRERERTGLLGAIAQLWTNPNKPEVRNYKRGGDDDVARRDEKGATRIFLQDVPGVLGKFNTLRIEAGEMFGELAALARTPRSATVFSQGKTELLEIRWQGLRDLHRRADALRAFIDQRYRERGLVVHLRETPLLAHLSEADIDVIADATEFETYGNFDWQTAFKTARGQSAQQRLAVEPIIAEEGHYPNGLILIRSGFARLSRRYGNGHRTISYLGKGQVYGLDAIAHNWRSSEDATMPLRNTLRAIGYVDILRIPAPVVEKYILPSLPDKYMPPLIKPELEAEKPVATTPDRIDTGMIEFLVENRIINGTATMMIDVNRCTRCDDCVRACAAAHDNNPRFTRHGTIYGHHMVANACMHCADPVCMIGCPTGAIHREPTTGDVVINDQTCIGCATCANSCPYSNIRMVEVRDTRGRFILDEATNTPINKATKCDLCVDQLGGPACQRACPHDALKRVDMNDVESLAWWLNR
ncbi:MAG: cyclic nucleotide-binding domain-containing protein [Planctomycetes bacterium]|nr:cyclic nucleotide-binding domain-containing protein [Planctomycetota bacterium]